MLVYVDPTGLGPGQIGQPYDKSSVAWTLGFGGYHLVTDVENDISRDGFSTKFTAKFVYRGWTGARDKNRTPEECPAKLEDIKERYEEYTKLYLKVTE